MSAVCFAYSVYGLDIRSTFELPGLRPSDGRGVPVSIHGVQGGEWETPAAPPPKSAGLEHFWRISDDEWLLRYGSNDTHPPWSITASAGGTRLVVRWCEPIQLRDIPALVVGPGLALALHMRRAFPLHASAIAVGSRAILIIGDSGAGKSTTAAALVRSGFPLISDDVAALETDGRDVRVHLGPGRLRIYEDSARAAGWEQPLPPLFSHEIFDDKRYIDLADAGMSGSTLSVAAICVLQPRVSNGGPSSIEPLAPRTALASLLANIYCVRFLDQPRMAAAAAQCAAIAGLVPIVAVRRPDDLAALPEVVEAIVGSSLLS